MSPGFLIHGPLPLAVPAQFSFGSHRHLICHVLALVSLSLMSPALGQPGPEAMFAAGQFFGVNVVSLLIFSVTRPINLGEEKLEEETFEKHLSISTHPLVSASTQGERRNERMYQCNPCVGESTLPGTCQGRLRRLSQEGYCAQFAQSQRTGEPATGEGLHQQMQTSKAGQAATLGEVTSKQEDREEYLKGN